MKKGKKEKKKKRENSVRRVFVGGDEVGRGFSSLFLQPIRERRVIKTGERERERFLLGFLNKPQQQQQQEQSQKGVFPYWPILCVSIPPAPSLVGCGCGDVVVRQVMSRDDEI